MGQQWNLSRCILSETKNSAKWAVAGGTMCSFSTPQNAHGKCGSSVPRYKSWQPVLPHNQLGIW